MNPSARYVTQQGFYDVPITGPLTDRKIAKYKKMGKYNDNCEVVAHAKAKTKKKRKARSSMFEGLFV